MAERRTKCLKGTGLRKKKERTDAKKRVKQKRRHALLCEHIAKTFLQTAVGSIQVPGMVLLMTGMVLADVGSPSPTTTSVSSASVRGSVLPVLLGRTGRG